MRFFIVDDDEAIRSMLSEIIEDNDLGEIVGEADNGAAIDGPLLAQKGVDVLLIDLLMPKRDGIETVQAIQSSFHGRIVMLSQVENKELIASAYQLGIHYYITKPINRIEVLSILRNVLDHLRMQKTIRSIEQNLVTLMSGGRPAATPQTSCSRSNLRSAGQYLLAELGMIGESGCKDLLDILDYLCQRQEEQSGAYEFPALKEMFAHVAMKRLQLADPEHSEVKKECKALEQRVRRAIFQGLNHLTSLGVTDYSNPKFEEYAPKFFDFSHVRKSMQTLQAEDKLSISDTHINSKKFIKVLFLEAQKR